MTDRNFQLIMVGLPGASKTTLARRVAETEGILRLTPDEWLLPLFGGAPADDGPRDVLEGRMLWVAHEVLRSGASVVVDFGCWSTDERYAVRAIAESAGAGFDPRFLDVTEPERRARTAARWAATPPRTPCR